MRSHTGCVRPSSKGDTQSSARQAAKSPRLVAFDAILPATMAARAEEIGVKKATTDP